MASAFKKGTPVKIKSPKSNKVIEGKFITTRKVTKGEFYEIDVNGTTKSYRPAQVTAA